MKLSARNRLKGKVVGIERGAVNSTVRIEIGGGAVVTAMITNVAVDELGLAEGGTAYAVVKASDVMVGVARRERRQADEAAGGGPLDRHRQAIDGAEPSGVSTSSGAPGEDAAVLHQQDPGGEREGLVGVVGRERTPGRELAARRARRSRQDAGLVAEVEAGGRLVHDDERRALRERPGDQGELALAAGDAGESASASSAMPSASSAACATARSARPGCAKRPRCAVRPISTTSRTAKGKARACACGT